MTTKEQERKALEQIKKIVEGLGEGSYVAAAFEGCFEDAESNIENHFAGSMKNRYEFEAKRRSELFEQNKKLTLKVLTLEDTVDRLTKIIEIVEANADVDFNRIKTESDQSVEALKKEMDARFEAEHTIEALNQTILELKAKLYDLIVKE